MISPARHLVVSIHDVSPFTQAETAAMLAELRGLGVSRTSLLVVPNHHRRGHFLDSPEFCSWLVAQAEAGHEVVMHGYYHQRVRRSGESARAKMITRVYTADEGEFFDIDESEARGLVEKAAAEFARLGLQPAGFIAPAWLLSDAGERALRSLGVEYTTRLANISDFLTGTVHPSQSLVWSVRSAWRRAASLQWNALLFRRLRRNPILRIGLHPPDLRHAAVWRQICALAGRALEDRVPMTYQTSLAERRSTSPS